MRVYKADMQAGSRRMHETLSRGQDGKGNSKQRIHNSRNTGSHLVTRTETKDKHEKSAFP